MRMARHFILLSLLTISTVIADEIAIITGRDTVIHEVNTKRLEQIFLKKNQLDDAGHRWIPLNLPSQHPTRLAFSQGLFNKRPEAMETYWNNQYFQGVTPPYVLSSEEAMLRFVASTSGAIGYALACHVDERVQIIWKLNVNEELNKNCETKVK